MLVIYSCLLFLALTALLPIYVFRSEVLKGESLHLGQRLGLSLPGRDPRKKAVWIHAVSVGEVLSLQNLIQQIRARHPSWEIFLSTLTNTGHRMAREKLRGVDHLFYVPFDFAWSVRRMFRAVRPSVLVLAESEFWPNLLREARRAEASVILANGRISDRSFGRYLTVKPLTRYLWPYIDLFLAQTVQDRRRLETLGVPAGRIRVTGNLKSDVRLRDWKASEIRRMKRQLALPFSAKVVVAGSTREGEEEALLGGFSEARRKGGKVALILAPRHLDRVPEVERACRAAGWTVTRKTRVRPGKSWDILILDTLGELAQIYAACDAAFIGGSLVPWGGHNILEPAYYGKPIFFGPYMHNFAYLAETFVHAGGAVVVRDKADLAELFSLRHGKRLEGMGRRAKRNLLSLQGATEKTIEAIESLMRKRD